MPLLKPTKTQSLLLEDQPVPLTIRRLSTARRYTVRYRPLEGDVLLTLPKRGSLREAVAFAQSRGGWLARQVAEHGKPVALADGAEISVLGKHVTLRHAQGRGNAWLEGSTLWVYGAPEFFARRARDALKTLLKAEIERAASCAAASIGKRATRIMLRDTSSRWGSCGSDGALCFSWRLVFAPREVMEYIICHEVAHLAEMNHGPRFWCVVEELYPAYRQARTWLNRHGQELYRYG